MSSLFNFFYNIIPGALLLIILELKFKISGYLVDNSLFLVSSVFAVSSLCVGFILQGLTKIFRKFFDVFMMMLVINDDRKSYQLAAKYILDNYENKSDKKGPEEKNSRTFGLKRIYFYLLELKGELLFKLNTTKRNFYFMHNYVLVNNASRYVDSFWDRLAFWSNIWWVALISFVLIYPNNEVFQSKKLLLLFLLIMAFAGYEFFEYLRTLYDCILKTFVIVIKEKKRKV